MAYSCVYHTVTVDTPCNVNKEMNVKICYQNFIYSPTDALMSCLKKTILKFTLKFILKQLRHVSVLHLQRNMSELF